MVDCKIKSSTYSEATANLVAGLGVRCRKGRVPMAGSSPDEVHNRVPTT